MFQLLKNKKSSHHDFYSTLLTLALPIAMQNFITSSLNLIDNIMIGRLGETEIAAVGLANQIFFLFHLFLFGINSGAAIFTAQFWGQKTLLTFERF
jgi:Na+-driven multidrug efflux pump